MPEVTIYTTPICPYCAMAKDLLREKKVAFTEIDVSRAELRQVMMQRAQGRRSVPQIFIGATHVGGCDDLHELDAKGKLDPLLAAA
jgi:glutaredoxin 3